MRLLTCTNLYPRPDDPTRGVFNASLFRALADRLKENGNDRLLNICLVPEWRTWKWRSIARWQDPFAQDLGTRYVPVFYIPVVGRNLSWRMYLASLRTLRGWGRGGDAMLATWLYPDAVAAAHFAEREGLPFWIKVHGSDRFHLHHPSRRGVILDACSHARGIISNCEFLAGQLAEAGIERGKIHVVPNGVDHARFRPIPRQEARDCLCNRYSDTPILRHADTSVVLYAGHLVSVKGPDRLLEAWKVLCERRQHSSTPTPRHSDTPTPRHSDTPTPRHPDTPTLSFPAPLLVMVGDGPMRRDLESMARDSGISDSVCFVGSRPHDEMALWMNAADCLCLPSRSEGMPNVVLENLACGRPVVASRVGDVPGLVRDGVDGFVVEDGPAFPDRLADALGRALDREWDREQIVSGTDRFTWERAAVELLAVMDES